MSAYTIFDEAVKEANKNDVHNLALFGKKVINKMQFVHWAEDVEEVVFDELYEFVKRGKEREGITK